jgi:hypothetical protein
MVWSVEYTDQFGEWWEDLSNVERADIEAVVTLLEENGPMLSLPYSSGIRGSRHGRMRELRVQSGGRPIRIFYAFDPRRVAILLIGGDKTGDNRFYEVYLPFATVFMMNTLMSCEERGQPNEWTPQLPRIDQEPNARTPSSRSA